MKAYTTGEWKRGENTASKEWMQVFCNGRVIVEAKPLNKIGQRQANDFTEEEANAKLIAAAPDLLEALQEFMFLSNPKNGDTLQAQKAIHELQTNYPAIWKKLEQAQGAINKAIQ